VCGARRALHWTLAAALTIGALFLAVQVQEYGQTWRSGLTLASEISGSCFYLLAGAHGLHVLGGLLFLAWVWLLAARRTLNTTRRAPLDACRMYWHFVVVAWILLFVFLYIR
jgi:cytochrome c oxidase subunit 3